MKAIEDDATLTVLAEAWVDCYLVRHQVGGAAAAVRHAPLMHARSAPLGGARGRQGGDKYKEAFFIYQELAQKYAVTVKLLNGQAVCHMLQGKYSEAEDLLMEALERVRPAKARERRARRNELTAPRPGGRCAGGRAAGARTTRTRRRSSTWPCAPRTPASRPTRSTATSGAPASC